MNLKRKRFAGIVKQRYPFCVLLTLTLVFAGFVTGCKDRAESIVNAGKQPCFVETHSVTAEQARRVVELSGITEPIMQATPAARVMAKVLSANFHEGEHVPNGRTLVVLDTRDLETRKKQARASLAAAQHALDIARTNLARKKDLYSTSDIPLAELEMAQLAESQASAGVSAAGAAVNELDINLSYAVVKAPFSGRIIRKMTEVGNMVAPGQPLLLIQDDARIRVVAPVGTDLAASLRSGDKIDVRIGEEKASGIIEGIVSSGDIRAPGLRVQILVDNPGYRYPTGVLAVVAVPFGKDEKKRITIPGEALVKIGQLSGVYVAGNDNLAHLRWLTLTEEKDGSLYVLTGLNEGERVILSPVKSGVMDGRLLAGIPEMKTSHAKTGISGWLAGRFIESKLTPLIMMVILAIGALAVWTIPKEDDPSLIVAAADVVIAYPGRGAEEIDERIAKPVGQWIKELRSAKHVYSSTLDDAVMFSIEFHSGITQGKALSDLYQQLNANINRLPSGTSAPLIKPRGVDDVAVLAATLSSPTTGPDILRRLAVEMADKLRALPNVSRVDVTGGLQRAVNVRLDARKLAERGLGADRVLQAIRASNVKLPAGRISGPDGDYKIRTGAFIKSAEDAAGLIIGVTAAGPVYLRDVATVSDGFAEAAGYVARIGDNTGWSACPAVTISINKVYGSNVTDVTRQARDTLASAAKDILPADVHLDITRDNGKVATTALNNVVKHMGLALLISVLLIVFTLGWRGGIIAAATLLITLLIIPIVYALTGFTLNRVSMAAMVFAIGLLIDNAIIIIENIHRHWHRGEKKSAAVAVKAVAEVGPPTILATLMVIMALVPTAFVTGMMGQYMRPLPVGASIGMFFSLLIALTVTPFLCNRIFQNTHRQKDDVADRSDSPPKKGLKSYYLDTLAYILEKPARAFGVYAVAILLLAAAFSLIPARIAMVESSPDKDSDEVSVMIDMPPRTSLENTYARAVDIARNLRRLPEVTACQVYAGTPAPLTFLGVARHYDLRSEPDKAEIHVQLKPAKERKRSSHEVTLHMRKLMAPMLSDKDSFFTVAELPAAQPTTAGVVAEIYAPDERQRLQVADKVKAYFSRVPGIVSIDWTARRGPPELDYEIDLQKAAARGVIGGQAADTVRTLMAGDSSVMAQFPNEKEGVPIEVRLSRGQRTGPEDIAALLFTPISGGMNVPATDIGKPIKKEGAYPLLRKDLQPVVMVQAESTRMGPGYAMQDISALLEKDRAVNAIPLIISWKDQIAEGGSRVLNWAGEWTIERDIYSDLGTAFIAVLFLIYAMLVAWYGSFLIPVIVMLPIPLIFIGVIPAHALLGQALNGAGTIGVIGLAGIVLRNSILLVDFARSHIADGMTVKEAVLQACSLRARPIIITALAIILGESVLYFDETLRGLGITMPSGTLISTLLTLGVVPVAYYQLASLQQRRALKK